MKKERNLLKLLTDDECLDASKKTFLTANLHKKSAETLSENGDFGIPVSHLILSTEQSIIGILLYLQHLGMNIRNIAGVHMFFTDHIIKHRLATMISLMYPMLKLFMGFVHKTKEKIHNPDAQIKYSEEEKALISKDEKIIQNIFKDLPEMMDWWEDANMHKNKGFYVDYTDSIETPMEVSESEYRRAFIIVNNFQKQISEIVSYFEKATEDDKKEIKNNSKIYDIDKILLPIIEERKKEMRGKGKNPIDIMNKG